MPVAHIIIQPTKGRKLEMTILNTTHICTLLPGSLCFWCNRLCRVWQSKRGGAGAAPCLGSLQHWGWAGTPRRDRVHLITTWIDTHCCNTDSRDKQREHPQHQQPHPSHPPGWTVQKCISDNVQMHTSVHIPPAAGLGNSAQQLPLDPSLTSFMHRTFEPSGP